MKKLLCIFILLFISLPVYAWNPLAGLFKGMIESKVADKVAGVEQKFNEKVDSIML